MARLLSTAGTLALVMLFGAFAATPATRGSSQLRQDTRTDDAGMAVEALGRGLTDPASGVVRNSLWALERIGSPRASSVVPAVVRIVAARDNALRSTAITTLASVGTGSKEASMALLNIIEKESSSKDLEIVKRAVWALGRIHDPSSLVFDRLIALLPDSRGRTEVDSHMAQMMKQIDPATVTILESTISDMAAEALLAFGRDAVSALLRAMSNDSPDVRSRAAECLGRLFSR